MNEIPRFRCRRFAIGEEAVTGSGVRVVIIGYDAGLPVWRPKDQKPRDAVYHASYENVLRPCETA